jgi:hypothetical protein
VENALEAGFQLAMFQGPLCEEPLEGIAVVIEEMIIRKRPTNGENGSCPKEKFIEVLNVL